MTRDPFATWMPSPFVTTGRNGYKPHYVILHGTAGGSSAISIANYFQRTSPPTNASSHYIIGPDGFIVQCADEDDWAWANGFLSAGHDAFWQESVNPNWISISIEHVKPSVDNSDSLTLSQKQASFALVKRICQRWQIPMRTADGAGGITGHYSIDPVNRSRCPGTYPWAELWDTLQGGGTMLDLTDLVVSRYFTDGGNGTWKCNNGVTLLGANLTFYRTYGGPAVLGLPLTNEIALNQYPSTKIVACERALIVYDPNRIIDKPPIDGPCYLLHLNSGIGQQIVAKALIDPLATQIAALQAQVKAMQAQVGTPAQVADFKDRLKQIQALSMIPS